MHAIIRNNEPEELFGGFNDNSGTQHPANVLSVWTPQELAAISVYPIVEPEIPEGKVAIGSTLGWDGDAVARIWSLEDAPAPTVDEVNAERARRLSLGFDYDFQDTRGVHRIGTTVADMQGWDEVTKGASAAIALGAGSSEMSIVTDTGPVTLTAMEWQSILVAATAFRQPIWQASFALQAMSPIPQNFIDDNWWS